MLESAGLTCPGRSGGCGPPSPQHTQAQTPGKGPRPPERPTRCAVAFPPGGVSCHFLPGTRLTAFRGSVVCLLCRSIRTLLYSESTLLPETENSRRYTLRVRRLPTPASSVEQGKMKFTEAAFWNESIMPVFINFKIP